MTLRNTKPFKDVIEGLTGRKVDLCYGKGVNLDTPHVTAVYVDPNGLMTAVVQFDLPLTAHLGAAVGMLPKGRAEDMINTRAPDEDLEENAAEVLNVLAAALTQELDLHQRLDVLHGLNEPTPGPVSVLAGSPARLDFDVDVTGYGTGAMSVATFPK